MLALFVYTIAVFGFCYIVGHSRITRPVRDYLAGLSRPYDVMSCPKCFAEFFRKQCPIKACGRACPSCEYEMQLLHEAPVPWFVVLMECPACLGTWIGLGAGILLAYPSRTWWMYPVLSVVFGLYTAGANFILGRLTGLIEKP